MKSAAEKKINVMIITVSDTRTKETDKSGDCMIQMLEQSDHRIVQREIVKDEELLIGEAIKRGLSNDEVEAILLNGGTGISMRDVTIEVVRSFLKKELPGFGEIFRFLSYSEDIGSPAILSRAIAGVVDEKAIFSVPGSTGAVKLAMEKLILPEIGHILTELHKHKS
jgi:molybdopterin adenylyltransferase